MEPIPVKAAFEYLGIYPDLTGRYACPYCPSDSSTTLIIRKTDRSWACFRCGEFGRVEALAATIWRTTHHDAAARLRAAMGLTAEPEPSVLASMLDKVEAQTSMRDALLAPESVALFVNKCENEAMYLAQKVWRTGWRYDPTRRWMDLRDWSVGKPWPEVYQKAMALLNDSTRVVTQHLSLISSEPRLRRTSDS